MTKEAASASWSATAHRADNSDGDPSWTVSGSADNGLGGSEFSNPNPNTASSKGGKSSSVRTKIHKGGGETITCTATVTAQLSGATQAGTVGSGSVAVSYSAGIITPHAHPADMEEEDWGPKTHAPAGGTTNTDPRSVGIPQGGVWVKMKWKSSSGGAANTIPFPPLIFVYEYVSYKGNANYSGNDPATPGFTQ